MDAFELNAEQRTATGRAENRRLRKTGRVPAIIYGGNEEPRMVSFQHNQLERQLDNEAFFSHVIKIHVEGGKTENVVLRDLQRHPAKPFIEHLDFLRVVAGETLRMGVPLHFISEDECPGVVEGSGIAQRSLMEVEVECLPGDLPEYIEVDCSQLQLNDVIHLSELTLPKGLTLVDLMGDEGEQNDLAVISIQQPQVAPAEEDEAAEEEGAEGGENAEGSDEG